MLSLIHICWVDGVRLVHKQFMGILEKNGLTEIPAEGAFNADLHEAVMQEEAEGVQRARFSLFCKKDIK